MNKTKRMILDVLTQLAYILLTFLGIFIATKTELHYIFRLGGVFLMLEVITRYTILHIQIKAEQSIKVALEKYKHMLPDDYDQDSSQDKKDD